MAITMAPPMRSGSDLLVGIVARLPFALNLFPVRPCGWFQSAGGPWGMFRSFSSLLFFLSVCWAFKCCHPLLLGLGEDYRRPTKYNESGTRTDTRKRGSQGNGQGVIVIGQLLRNHQFCNWVFMGFFLFEFEKKKVCHSNTKPGWKNSFFAHFYATVISKSRWLLYLLYNHRYQSFHFLSIVHRYLKIIALNQLLPQKLKVLNPQSKKRITINLLTPFLGKSFLPKTLFSHPHLVIMHVSTKSTNGHWWHLATNNSR